MIKHDFKIGDNVKLTPDYIHIFPQTTEIGKVVGFDDDYILVSYNGCCYKKGFPYVSKEIECVVKIGEQLMFEFMND